MSQTIQEFRKLLRRATFISAAEEKVFARIPDAVLEGIFKHNFNGNMALARRVLLNRHSEVDATDRAALEKTKLGIAGLDKAVESLVQALGAGRKVLFITDNDNDGSLAQAVLMEFIKVLPAHQRDLVNIEYAQPIGKYRGLTREVVDLSFQDRGWSNTESVLLITADNGINNSAAVEGILASYPATDVIITDHHLPDKDLVVKEGPRTMIVNPKYKPTPYFTRKNISGANTLGVMLSQVVQAMAASDQFEVDLDINNRQALANMAEIGSWANLLDYANADIADMPIRPYIVQKALELRPLLNVSNSMANLVTGDFSDEQVKAVSDATIRQDNPGLPVEWVRDKLERASMLNEVARRMLTVYHQTKDLEHTYGPREFYSMLATQVLAPSDEGYRSINPNYIEQLRPVIFNAAAIDNKDAFFSEMAGNMRLVFEDLRRLEREILEGLRSVKVLEADIRENSTIFYPVDSSVMRVFNRRLLGKAYNRDNNGFSLVLDHLGQFEVRGSMRSMYPISAILEDKSEIEDQLGIKVSYMGHEMAAGFFIVSTDGTEIDQVKLADFNRWMDDRVGELKLAEKVNRLPTMEVDFASISVIDKVNRAVKANLAGMWGLPAVLRLERDPEKGVWITDPETTGQVNLQKLIETKSFGYQAVQTNFAGGAIVIPVELIRSVIESDFDKMLRLDYMDEDVFMATQAIASRALPRLVNAKSGRHDKEELSDYYEKTFKHDNFIQLSRKDLQDLPYFRFNKHGASEFEMWEGMVVEMLDELRADVLAVMDTEGTGLGKAPKCFNLGSTNLMIEAGSGSEMPVADFETRYFQDRVGQAFLLTPMQRSSLVELDGDSDPPDGWTLLTDITLEEGVSFTTRYAFAGKTRDLERVTNVKKRADGTVVYNRRLTATASAFLINNQDFSITKELEDLTGIDNEMVKRLGMPAERADRLFCAHYENLKKADGTPATVVFQAHNMPYDRGVVSANFPRLLDLMSKNLTSDTAKIARSAKLAYDDTPVASIGLPGFQRLYFYDSPYSDYSLSTFLDICRKGKGGVYPDIGAKVLLRYNPESERFSLIDRASNNEVEIDASLEMINKEKTVGQLPNNALRYSVERLSSRAMIRNIIMLDKPAPQRIDLHETEEPYRAALELFQDKYHFDIEPKDNINHFVSSLQKQDINSGILDDVDMASVVDRFLHKNRAIQAKFHDGWIYEKVLSIYEPDKASRRVPAEVLEEINYYTDIPAKKIKEVLDAVVTFKRKFDVEHALVHEQHNNIRQQSADGQNLSDTAYESALPSFLAMMKLFNPYYQSVRPAARAMIDQCIGGSMVQSMMSDDVNDQLVSDSFSMRQMMSFARRGKSMVVQKAEKMAADGKGADGLLESVKMRLKTDVLAPGSALYALPKGHTSLDQIREDSDTLKQIAVAEQVKIAAGGDTFVIAEAFDDQHRAKRDELLDRYHRIDWSRRDDYFKKVLDLANRILDGLDSPLQVQHEISKVVKLDENEMEIARGIGATMAEIRKSLHPDFTQDHVNRFLDQFDHALQGACFTTTQRAVELGERLDRNPIDGNEVVRTPEFMFDLDTKRREPMKFALKHLGMEFLIPAIKSTMPPPQPKKRPGP